MAKQGKNAAYQQLTSPTSTLVTDLKYWNDDAFRKKQQESIDKEKKLARQDAEAKDRQKRIEEATKNLTNWDTGTKSITEMQGRALMDAVDQIGELLDITDYKNSGKYSKEEVLRAQTKLGNLKKAGDNLKLVTDKWAERDNEIMTAAEKGLIKKNENFDNYLNFKEKGLEKGQIIWDDMGMPMIAYRDLDGDGINDVETYGEITANQSPFKFDKHVDPMQAAKSIIDNDDLKVKNVTDSNYLKRTVEGYDPERVEFASRSAIVDTNGDLTDLGESMLKDMGVEDSVENREKVYQSFKKIVDEMTPQEQVTEDFDYGARNTANKTYMQYRDDEGNTAPTDSEAIEISESTWGGSYFKNIDKDKVVSKSGGNIVLEAPKDFSGKVYNDSKVLNYTFDKFGSLLLDIEYVDSKEKATKTLGEYEGDVVTTKESNNIKRKVIQPTKDDARDFAEKLGMTVDELKKSVQKEDVPENNNANENKQDDQNTDPLGLF